MESSDHAKKLDDNFSILPFDLEFNNSFNVFLPTEDLGEHSGNNVELSLRSFLPESTSMDPVNPAEHCQEWMPQQVPQTAWPVSTDEGEPDLLEFRYLLDLIVFDQNATELENPVLEQIGFTSIPRSITYKHSNTWDANISQNHCKGPSGSELCQNDLVLHSATDSGTLNLLTSEDYSSEAFAGGGTSAELNGQFDDSNCKTGQATVLDPLHIEKPWLVENPASLATIEMQDTAGVIATASTILDTPGYTEISKSLDYHLDTLALSLAPNQTQTPKKQRKGRKAKGHPFRIPEESRLVLEEHFSTNPYPTARDMDILAQMSNLETKTVKNWFNNTRSRKRALDDQVNSITFKSVGADDSSLKILGSPLDPRRLNADIDSRSIESNSSGKLSIDRYLAAPLNEEPASATAIESALRLQSSLPPSTYDKVAGDRRPQVQSEFWGSIFPDRIDDDITSNRSISVIGSRCSSASEDTSYSVSSHGSSTSSFCRARRQGRKRWRHSPYSIQSKAAEKSNDQGTKNVDRSGYLLFCTFCKKPFRAKYEWKRHEESVHMPQKRWICCYLGKADPIWCPFCPEVFLPNQEHLAKHRYQECRRKPETERTFTRKDLLLQHIRNTHNPSLPPLRVSGFPKEWELSPPSLDKHDPVLSCGFCEKWFPTWRERSDHVANHFKAGLDMNDWSPIQNAKVLADWARFDLNYCRPYRCIHCKRTFPSSLEAKNEHSQCSWWSCSHLPFDWTAIFSEKFGAGKFDCLLCNDTIDCQGEHNNEIREHALSHKYRRCDQRSYFVLEDFAQHLEDVHGGLSDPFSSKNESVAHSLSTIGGRMLFATRCMWTMPAVFEPAEEPVEELVEELVEESGRV